jgi:hypothetical protein
MFWRILLASLVALAISIPGHLIADRLWLILFGPLLEGLFRNRRRTGALKTMWLDFINMFATNFLALFGALLILGKGSPPLIHWLPIGIVAATSCVMVAVISTRERPSSADGDVHPPATPMMTAGALAAILLGIILVQVRA